MTKPPRRSLIRRIVRFLGLGLAVLLLVATVLYLFRGTLLAGPLARFAADRMSAALGGEFTLERIEGSWFGDLELVGLETVSAPADGPLRKIAFSRVRVAYDVTGFFGERPQDAVTAIEAADLVLELDLTRPSPPGEEPPPTPDEIARLIPTALPRTAVDARIVVTLANGEIRVGKLGITGGGDRIDVVLQNVSLPPDLPALPDGVALRIERPDRGHVEIATARPLLGLDLESLALAAPTPAWTAGLRATFAGGRITADVTADRAEARIAGLAPAALPQWLRDMIPPDVPFPGAGAIDAKAAVAPWNVDSPVGSFDVQVRDLAVGEITGASLDLRGEGGATELVITDLAAALGEARLEGRGVRVRPELPQALASVESFSLTLPDARRLLEGVGVDASAVPWPASPVAVSARLSGRRGEPVRVEELGLRSGRTRIDVTGTVTLPEDPDPETWDDAILALKLDGDLPALEEVLDAIVTSPRITGAVTLSGDVGGTTASPTCRLDVTARGLHLDTHRIGDVASRTTLDWPRLRLERLEVNGDGVRVAGGGELNLEEATIAPTRLELTASDVSFLEAYLEGSPDLTGALVVRGDVRKEAGPWDRGYRGSLVVEGTDLAVDGRGIGRVRSEIDVDGPRIELKTLRVQGDVAVVRGGGLVVELEHDVPALIAPELVIAVDDLATLGKLLPGAPKMSGRLEARLAAEKPADVPWSGIAADGRVTVAAFVLDEIEVGEATVSLRGRDRIFDLDGVRASGPWGELTATGRVELDDDGGGRGELKNLTARLRDHPLELMAPARAAWTANGHVRVDDLALRAFGGEIRGHASLADVLDAALHASGINLAAVPGEHGLTGKVALDLTASGTPEAPTLDVRCNVPTLGWRDRTAALTLHAGQDATSLRVLEARLTDDVGTRVELSGRVPAKVGREGLTLLPWASGDLELDAVANDPALFALAGVPAEVRIDAVSLKGGLRGGRLGAVAAVEGGRITVDEQSFELPPRVLVDVDADAASARATIRAEGLERMTLDGAVSVSRGLGDAPSAETASALGEAGLDGRLRLKVPDLTPFAALVPALVRLGGRLEADLVVGGTVAAPTPRGQLRADDLAVRAKGATPSLTDGMIRIDIEGDTVNIETIEGQLGYSPVKVSGTVRLPTEEAPPTFSIRAKGENALLVRDQHLRARADLDIEIEGPLDGLLVSGEVVVTDALFSEPISLVATGAPTEDDRFQIFSFTDAPLSTTKFDLHVLANRSIRVDNNVARGRLSMDLQIKGTGAVPSPEGRVYFTDLKVQLPFSRLNLKRGDIVFEKDDPFAPRLAINGETRMQGYDLFIDVLGRMPDQNVNIRAEPFLPQEDAIFLLTVGSTRSGLQEEGLSRAALTRAASLLGTSLIADLMGPSDPDAESYADRFTLEVGRDVSRTGASTIEAEFRILEAIFLRAERDRYDDYNVGGIWRLRFR